MITAATVRRIREFDSGELPVISLYLAVPVDPHERNGVKTRVNSLLEQVRPLGEDESLSHIARLSVRQDLERIEELGVTGQPPAVAIFSCAGKNFLEQIHLPRRVRDRIVADATAWIRPMTAVLEEFHRTLVLVTDSNTAYLWELFQGETQRLEEAEDPALRKSNYAGWHGLMGRTVANKAEELEKHHLLRVVEMLDHVFLDPSYELLVLGGQHDTLARLEAYLPRRLRDRLAGTFSVDPRPNLEPEIRERASALVQTWEREDEKRQVQDVFERAASRRPAAIGLRECLWAAATGAVEHLLVDDDVAAPGVICPRDGWLGESSGACPLCATPTRPTTDIIDELVERVIDEGGSVEHVEVRTELEPHLVGAVLRFAPAPSPPSLGADATAGAS